MPGIFLLKRGTAAECDTYRAREGEPFVDLTNMQLRIGDGATVGGVIVAQIIAAPSGQLYAEVADDKRGRPFVLMLPED